MTIEGFETIHRLLFGEPTRYVSESDPQGSPRAKPTEHLFAPLHVPLSY